MYYCISGNAHHILSIFPLFYSCDKYSTKLLVQCTASQELLRPSLTLTFKQHRILRSILIDKMIVVFVHTHTACAFIIAAAFSASVSTRPVLSSMRTK